MTRQNTAAALGSLGTAGLCALFGFLLELQGFLCADVDGSDGCSSLLDCDRSRANVFAYITIVSDSSTKQEKRLTVHGLPRLHVILRL